MNKPKISEVAILKVLRDMELIDAENFCDRWHSLDQLDEEARYQAKSKHGYRAKCVRLLAAVLRVEESTVNSWGSCFERMPEHYKPALLYADVIRRNLKASADTNLLDLYLDQQDREN